MSSNWHKPGINHVGEFQVSGHTFVVTGSGNVIDLNYVASSITVSADGADKEITFYDTSGGSAAFTVPTNTTCTFKGKFLRFAVPAGADALVEVTNIPSSSYRAPTFTEMHRVS
jgi:hypothetical protein